jgi:hypothetical protein
MELWSVSFDTYHGEFVIAGYRLEPLYDVGVRLVLISGYVFMTSTLNIPFAWKCLANTCMHSVEHFHAFSL